MAAVGAGDRHGLSVRGELDVIDHRILEHRGPHGRRQDRSRRYLARLRIPRGIALRQDDKHAIERSVVPPPVDFPVHPL
jgi:hypothetical protein